MSTIPARALPDDRLAPGAPSKVSWMPILLLALLLVACYAPVLYRLGIQWANDEDMGHGFFVPVIAGYIAWQRRSELAAIEFRPNYWGLAIMGWGAAQMLLGALAAELFLSRTAFLISLAGLLLVAGGARLVRALAFPLLLLLFMIPIPQIVYSQITLPLQLFASRVAEWLLGLIGIPVLRDGNVLHLPSETLSVVEACSGIRSLLSLSFLSLIYAYFFDRKVWMRVALLVATVPIAIAANSGRVTLTGILSEYAPSVAHGFFHTLEGGALFMVALAILILVHQGINAAYNAWIARSARAA
jgi:exosortase